MQLDAAILQRGKLNQITHDRLCFRNNLIHSDIASFFGTTGNVVEETTEPEHYSDIGTVSDRSKLSDKDRRLFLKQHFKPSRAHKFLKNFHKKSGKNRFQY